MLKKKKGVLSLIVCLSLSVTLFAGCNKPSDSGNNDKELDYPKRDVEVVVNTNPGDGVFMFAQAIAEGLTKNTDVNFNVVSKTGGSGANQMSYVATKKGDPYYISTCQPSTITTPIKNKLELTYKEFTPICGVIAEPYVYVVREDSPFKTFEDLIKYAKENPDKLIQGTGVYGANDTVLSTLVQNETGADFNIVPFEDGGKMLVAVLGGDADFISANPSELLDQIEAGKLRPLAVASEKRLETMPDVPTLKEMGIDVVFQGFRGIMAAGEIDEKVVDYLEQEIKKVSETDAFKKYMKDNCIDYVWKSSEELKAYWEELDKMYKDIYEQMGLLK